MSGGPGRIERASGLCDCGWCQRARASYGNADVPTNRRPVIRNMPAPDGTLVLEISGRCTRCHYPLGDRAFMVRERVLAQAITFLDGSGLAIHDHRKVPVCEVCITDQELDNPRKYKVDCHGCGCHLVYVGEVRGSYDWRSGNWRSPAACCNACYRTALRKQRRIKRRECANCGCDFRSPRVDARFCSGACRQDAYRKRGKHQVPMLAEAAD